MNTLVINFIRDKNIDSYQKLYVLLFLFRHPELSGTCKQFAELLYFGEVTQLANIIDELRAVGLVKCVENRYALPNDAELRFSLQCLAKAFANPLARQDLLEHVHNNAFAASVDIQTYSDHALIA